jgi:hypothetical protein
MQCQTLLRNFSTGIDAWIAADFVATFNAVLHLRVGTMMAMNIDFALS